LSARLERLQSWFPGIVSGVRGRGLIRGLTFHDAALPAELVRLARERGVLLLTAGKDAVRFVPSLTVDAGQIDLTLDVVESCLTLLARQEAEKVGASKPSGV
jgi:acetylornithine aminotransferase